MIFKMLRVHLSRHNLPSVSNHGNDFVLQIERTRLLGSTHILRKSSRNKSTPIINSSRSTNGEVAASPKTLVKAIGGQGPMNVNSWAPDSMRFAYVIYDVLP
jgi:hypothetical protein